MKDLKKITIDDYLEARHGKKFRIKVEYKSDNEEDEYRFDKRRAIEESQK